MPTLWWGRKIRERHSMRASEPSLGSTQRYNQHNLLILAVSQSARRGAKRVVVRFASWNGR